MLSVIKAEDKIQDKQKILKDNQAVVIDAKNNTISYILEIRKDGSIIKKYIDDKTKQKLAKMLNLSIKNSIKNKIASKPKKQISTSKIYKKSNITQWDKRKIIYEQVVEKIDLIR